MIALEKLLPDAEALLSLEPEELAGPLLYYLSLLPPLDHRLHVRQFLDQKTLATYPQKFHEDITKAFVEAWVWLEREGLIAPRPSGGDHGWIFVTRRGARVSKPEDLEAYRKANLLPRHLLHGRIAHKVWTIFLRGDYDVAVFQAFKEVEVCVRENCRFADDDYGVSMMRRAFALPSSNAPAGPLTDANTPKGEQEATIALFSGAIGLCKNPTSHRNVRLEAVEAVEMIVLASHLLNVLDRRALVCASQNDLSEGQ